MSLSTELMFHHEWGMHDTLPHPSCPICERQRVQDRVVVDAPSLDQAFADLAEAHEELENPHFVGDDFNTAMETCEQSIGAALDQLKAIAKHLAHAKTLKTPEAIHEHIGKAESEIGELKDSLNDAGGNLKSAESTACELVGWACDDSEEQFEALEKAVSAFKERLEPFAESARPAHYSATPERLPW